MTFAAIVRYQLPVFLWMALIYFLSSQTFVDLPPMLPGTDKVVHMAIYAVLCALLHRAFRFQPNRGIASMSLFIGLGLTVLYGISDEMHQFFVPGRSSDVFDVMADLSGGILYALLYWKFKFYETA